VNWSAVVLVLCSALALEAQSDQLLVSTTRGPAPVELQIELDGKPYSLAWERYLDLLFRDLDTDGDGMLSRTEAARAPSAAFIATFLHGALNLDAAQAVAPFDQLDVSRTSKVSHADFTDYYQRTGLNRMRLTTGPQREQAQALSDALFQLLGDGAGRIPKDNLKRARELLNRVDLNEDEWITPDEILLQGPDTLVAKQTRSTLEGLGVTLSAHGEKALANAPVGVLAIRLGGRERSESDVDWLAGSATWRRIVPTARRLSLDGVEIDIRTGPGSVSRALGMHAFYRQQFQAAASGQNGGLDAKRAEAFPVLAALFRLADRDCDGRLTTKEFEAFLALHAQGAQSFVTATVSDQSPGLFELLDENGDGRLSLRELHTACQRLQKLMGKGENSFERKHLPRRVGLEISRGGPTPHAARPQLTAIDQSAVAGPVWFRRMDRNGDGYVSRREFLGSLEQFKLLDQDGDGLISPEEAEKLEARPNKHPVSR
jgi:Ca2+-binding EF-hand superfamily protein